MVRPWILQIDLFRLEWALRNVKSIKYGQIFQFCHLFANSFSLFTFFLEKQIHCVKNVLQMNIIAYKMLKSVRRQILDQLKGDNATQYEGTQRFFLRRICEIARRMNFWQKLFFMAQ